MLGIQGIGLVLLINKTNAFWIVGILCALAIVLIIISIIRNSGLSRAYSSVYDRLLSSLYALLSIIGAVKKMDNEKFDETIEISGYAYDESQDIFYSVINPWQRSFGYCRLYDEAAAPLGMIMDCEPIYFEYEGKRWLIEFWKGQYDLPTGCELGIYTTEDPDLIIPGFYNGPFYNAAKSEDYLDMSLRLFRKGKLLFSREGKHWWLTGFRLGKFSQTWELKMEITINLKNEDMCNVFLEGMKRAGYLETDITRVDNTVSFVFDKPRTPQPYSRSLVTDAMIQMKNKLLCDTFNEVTRGCTTIREKIEAVKLKAPELSRYIEGMGRPRELYESFETAREFSERYAENNRT
ncbi:MAG: DUF4474 domain-containing protein [Clostridiaceae bacterium]|nr:DUF4474 domain-containing protein [Clostridiaceae bacterium]